MYITKIARIMRKTIEKSDVFSLMLLIWSYPFRSKENNQISFSITFCTSRTCRLCTACTARCRGDSWSRPMEVIKIFLLKILLGFLKITGSRYFWCYSPLIMCPIQISFCGKVDKIWYTGFSISRRPAKDSYFLTEFFTFLSISLWFDKWVAIRVNQCLLAFNLFNLSAHNDQ